MRPSLLVTRLVCLFYDFVDDLAVDVNADSLAGIEKAVAENVTQMIVPRNSDCA